MNINLIAFGKLKEISLRQAEGEYIKRIRAYVNMRIIELPEERLPEKPSSKIIQAALLAESGKTAKYLSEKHYNIAMCIEGKQMSSDTFSQTLSNIPVKGISTINFLIGSSFGLDEKLKSNVDLRLSLSEMTFPHQFARIMLLEQIYRAFQISTGGKYHK